jgi:putative ABC transport system permease protein
MKLKEILKISWAGLASNRVRALLTMLGVIIGVAAVIVMVAISAGTEATIAEQIEALGTNLVFISQGNFALTTSQGGFRSENSLVYDDAVAIGALSGVSAVTVERSSMATVKAGTTSVASIFIDGTTPDYPKIRELTIQDGRFLTQQDLDRKNKVVVLGSTLATDLFGEESPVGQTVMVGSVRLTIIGVMAKKGVVGGTDYDNRLYLPITVVFQKFTPSMFSRVAGDRVNSITVQVKDLKTIDATILQIKLLLASRYDSTVENLPFTVSTQQEIIDTRAATSAAFRNLLAGVAAVSLVVGGIGIMNIMLVSVTERTREIGIRQSVGATPGDIRWQFLVEALLLSLTGGLIGVLVGVGGAWVSNATSSMRAVVRPESIALAFGAAALIGIFFGYYPANKASQMDPIEALRHE